LQVSKTILSLDNPDFRLFYIFYYNRFKIFLSVLLLFTHFSFSITFEDSTKRELQILKTLKGQERLDEILNIASPGNYGKINHKDLFLLLDQAQAIADSLDDNFKLARTHQVKGSIHSSLGNYQEALNNNLIALGFFEQVNNLKGIASCLNNIGIIYEAQNDYDKAIDYFNMALKVSSETDDSSTKAAAYNNLGLCFEAKKDYLTAMDYYLKSMAINEEQDNKIGVSIALHNIGGIYKIRQKYPKALEYFNRSLEITKEFNDLEGMANDFFMIGEVYREVKLFPKAIDSYSKSLDIAHKINLKPIISDNYHSLFLLHKERQDYKKALFYHENYLNYKDSLFNENSSGKILELQAKYDFESKEREIDLLNIRRELQEAEIKEKQTITLSLAAGLVLFIVLLFLSYRQFRLKQKANKVLNSHNQNINFQNIKLQTVNKKLLDSEAKLKNLNATKDKFFSIISHDLRSPLNSLSGLLQLIIKYSENLSKEEMIDITTRLDKSVNDLSNLLNNLLQWSMSQMGSLDFKPEKNNLKKIVNENLDLVRLQAENKGLQLKLDLRDNVGVLCDKNMLNFILRNLLSNSIKFTSAGGTVSVEAKNIEGVCNIYVKDTGVGINPENLDKLFKLDEHYTTQGTNKETGTGLGLILCKEFVEKNNGTIKVESKQGVGTKFIIKLPSFDELELNTQEVKVLA
jgi:signal transduction histidine kinase/tetratricopeptide (TPR) repeat protein